MTVFGLAWRGVRQRPLTSSLTAVSVALGVALAVAVLSLRTSVRDSYTDVARGYDAILGPTHGSPLQIVLNTMFHVGDAGGTVPWEIYEEARKHPHVATAVPYAVGDSFMGHHVIGTSSDLFRVLADRTGVPLESGMSGSVFRDGDHFEAVIGSLVLSDTPLRLGTRFRVTHGLEASYEEHAEEWTVVGVLRPTGTPADRGIFIPLDTFYEVGGHKRGAEQRRKANDEDPPPGEAEEEPGAGHEHGAEHGQESAQRLLGLSAIGIRLKAPILRLRFLDEYRSQRKAAQCVIPHDQVQKLLAVVGDVDRYFEGIAWLVILVAGLGIIVSLTQAILARRREIAILRSLGARPWHVFAVTLIEAECLVLLGGVLGLLLGHMGLTLLAPTILERFGAQVDAAPSLADLRILGALGLFALVVGLLPAWRALRTPVARNLQGAP